MEKISITRTMKPQRHNHEHSQIVKDCGICRIKTLERDASAEKLHAGLALYTIAFEATRALERLIAAKTKEVSELVPAMTEWPVIANVNVKDSQKVPAALGTDGAGVPISWKKLFTLNKVPHWILYRLFSIIGLLRTLHSEGVAQSHRRAAGVLPQKLNFSRILKLVEKGVSADSVFNVLASNISEGITPPECHSAPKHTKKELSAALARMAESLGVPMPKSNAQFIRKFTAEAVALHKGNELDMESWFELAWKILRAICGGSPGSVPRLRNTLARGRGGRKTNREGTPSKDVGDIEATMKARLRAPLTTLKPGIKVRKNAKAG